MIYHEHTNFTMKDMKSMKSTTRYHEIPSS